MKSHVIKCTSATGLNAWEFVMSFRFKIIFTLAGLISFAHIGFAEDAYTTSIVKAALHSEGTPSTPLTTIQGTHVEMVTFTNYTGYKTTDTQLGGTVWTTVEPDLKTQCETYVKQHPHATHQELTRWIAELLGVSPNQAETRQFVVMDVPVIQAYYGTPESPVGIFRPCTDPRIAPHADGTPACPLQMNATDTNIASDYKTWFINNSISSYTLAKNAGNDAGAPWTEYGFTYNWNKDAQSVFGVSEFVVLKNTPVTILPNPDDGSTAYVTPEAYCGMKS